MNLNFNKKNTLTFTVKIEVDGPPTESTLSDIEEYLDGVGDHNHGDQEVVIYSVKFEENA